MPQTVTRNVHTLVLVLAFFALLCDLGSPACARVFYVDAPDYAHSDVLPGDGICADGRGLCTFQAAMEEAGALEGRHIIDVGNPNIPYRSLNFRGAVIGELSEVTVIHQRPVDQVQIKRDSPGIPLRVEGALFFEGFNLYFLGEVRNHGELWINNCRVKGGTYVNLGYMLVIGSEFYGAGSTVLFNSGSMEVVGSTFSENTGLQGGAIFNDGELAVGWTTFRRNRASEGGAIYLADGSFSARLVSFEDNAAWRQGGAVAVAAPAWLELRQSALTDNVAHRGGGIWSRGLGMVVNTTIAGNWADEVGGGMAVEAGRLELANVTIVENEAGFRGDGEPGGGGIWSGAEEGIEVQNSIIAANRDLGARSDPDCAGLVISRGFNLVGQVSSSCAWVGYVELDLLGEPDDVFDPELRPRSWAPGLDVPFYPPQSGSPVINAGDLLGCVDPDPSREFLESDQAERPRPVDRCDIGAIEVQ